MRQPLVAGNWKMNGSTETIKNLLEGIKQSIDTVSGVEVVVCPPYVYLPGVQQQLAGTAVSLGSQNISEHKAGAYTGEISASMLLEFRCRYAIVGHSERRTFFGESDPQVAAKYAAARAAGIVPVLCLGEILEERERGVTEDVVARQLDAVVAQEGIEALADGVIAYEPVWAIGTGKTASPDQAQEVHAFIRGRIAQQCSATAEKVRILYGGSVKGANAPDLFSMPDIDGGLIGGASLDADEFVSICRAAC